MGKKGSSVTFLDPKRKPRHQRGQRPAPSQQRGREPRGMGRPAFRPAAARPAAPREGGWDREAGPRPFKKAPSSPRFGKTAQHRPEPGPERKFRPVADKGRPFFSKAPRKPFGPKNERPPHPRIFRDTESKPHSPSAGPRHFSKRAQENKPANVKRKPNWVRGKTGSVRRQKGSPSQSSGLDNHGLEFPT
jgi:hypothetical protein